MVHSRVPLKRWSLLRVGLAALAIWLGLVKAPAQEAQSVWVVDVLVVYTPAGRAGAGGTPEIESSVQAALMEANLVLENSRVNARLRLVHMAEIAYEESGSVSADLARLRDAKDGFMDEVHPLRDQRAADLVCLVTETGDDYWFYGLQGPSAANAFSVIRRPYLTGSYLFPVTLSFSLGCQLERPYADSVGAFPYAYGYSFTGLDGLAYGTVESMTENRLPWFSNPSVLLQGRPSGAREGQPGAADNARTINQTAPLLAAFRGGAMMTTLPHVAIVSPLGTTSSPLRVNEDTNLVITAEASDFDGFVQRVDFCRSENGGAAPRLLGSVSNSPFTFVWHGVPAGDHTLFAVAVDDAGATARSSEDLVLSAAPVPPRNDSFADATMLVGTNVSVNGRTTTASLEDGEPDWGGGSVWFSWTAPANGRLTLSLPNWSYGSVFGATTGETVSNLTTVANNSAWWGWFTAIEFDVTAGRKFFFYVAGSAGDLASYTLHLAFQPMLQVRLTSPEPGGLFSTTNMLTLTAEANAVEPAHVARVEFFRDGESIGVASNAPYTAVWANPAAGEHEIFAAVFDDQGGSRVSALVRIAVLTAIDVHLTSPEPGGVFSSTNSMRIAAEAISIEPTRVTRVEFVVDGNPIGVCSNAPFATTWTRLVPGPHEIIARAYDEQGASKTSHPVWVTVVLDNDSFADRVVLQGLSVSAIGSTATATREPGEPNATGYADDQTAWWSWTAPLSGRATLTVWGLTFWPVSGIYSGSSVSNLTEITAGYSMFGNPVALSFDAQQGAEYNIVMSGMYSYHSSGEFHFALNLTPPPSNDSFADRLALVGSSLSVTSSTTSATLEAGEANQGGNTNGHSVWWTWAAPVSGNVEIQATGNGFTPVLTVSTGDQLPNLLALGVTTNVPFSFRVVAGVGYQIGVDGLNGGYGTCVLRLDSAPVNDDFTNRTSLAGFNLPVLGSNIAASVEPGEPVFPASPCGRSVWWNWTAPADGVARISVASASVRVVLAVYTGTEFSNLVQVAMRGDQIYPQVLFPVKAGLDYAVMVAGLQSGGVAQSGTFAFNIVMIPAPLNDNFTNRLAITGTNVWFCVTNTGASREPGEPLHAPDIWAAGHRSAWWQWTAPTSGVVTVRSYSWQVGTLLGVYQGNSLTSLTPVGTGREEWLTSGGFPGGRAITFTAQRGQVFQIAADSYQEQAGELWMWVVQFVPTANDRFGQRVVLNGTNLALQWSNGGATAEPGEPMHAWGWGVQPNRSVWWSWTAPTGGVVNLNVQNSAFPAAVAVYTGGALSTLSRLGSWAADFFSLVPVRASFAVEPGRAYEIAVDSLNSPYLLPEGAFDFSLLFLSQPSNDNFDQVARLTDATTTIQASATGATRQANEPDHGSGAGLGSMWWQWTVPRSATGIVDVRGSGTPAFASVYVGSALTNLTRIAGGGARALFAAEAGVNYFIAVEADGGASDPTIRLSAFLSDLRIVTPTNNAAFDGPSNILVSASASELDGSFSLVEFLANGSVIGTASDTPFGIIWGNPPPANYSLTLRATNSAGLVHETLPIAIALHPRNDAFASRTRITGTNITISCDIRNATLESNEPTVLPNSAWWSWTAPTSGRVYFLAAHAWYIAGLAVFTGASLPELQLVASGDYQTWFDVVEGTEYQIAVACAGFTWEPIQLSLVAYAYVANNVFSNRTRLEGYEVLIDAAFLSANKEPGEPDHAGRPGGSSMWWTWTPPATGYVTLSVSTAGWPPLLAAYTGDSLSNLVPVAASASATMTFRVETGVDYQLALDRDSLYAGEFTLSLVLAPSPVNDDFAHSIRLVGSRWTTQGSTVNAQREEGEMPFTGEASGQSVWYIWTAPLSGVALLTSPGDPVPLSCAVYTGAFVSNLTSVANGLLFGAGLTFNVEAGTTYHIGADGTWGWPLEFTLSMVLHSVPGNDQFSNRVAFADSSVLLLEDNAMGSSEPEEPLLGGADGKTLWWSWTAPTNGTVVITRIAVPAAEAKVPKSVIIIGDHQHPRLPPLPPLPPAPAGQAAGPLVGVYTGEEFGTLTLVASNNFFFAGPWYEPGWRVLDQFSYSVTAGMTYQISVDTCNGSAGDVSLELDFLPPPPNDLFSIRSALSGLNVSTRGYNFQAGKEPGEPDHAGQSGGSSVWWTWASPVRGGVTIEVTSPFPPLTAVYKGTGLSSLTPVAAGSSSISFFTEAGETYQICIDGEGGADGVFGWALSLVASPLNDMFAASIGISGTQVTVEGSTLNARSEPGEPAQPGSSTGASVWYDWRAPSSGHVSLSAVSWSAGLTVYAGPSLTELVRVSQPSQPGTFRSAEFYALAGQLYHIAVSDESGTEGSFVFQLVAPPPPPTIDGMMPAMNVEPGFGLRVGGLTGQSFVVQASSNLVDWESVAIDTLQGRTADLLDADAAQFPHRFYRVLPLDAVLSPARQGLRVALSDFEGIMALRISGPPAQPFRLLASPDLAHWHEVGRGWIVGEFVPFMDPEGSSYPVRFYRAEPLP
jgi:hypothetical protein